MICLQPFGPDDYEQLIGWIDSAESLMQFAGPAFTFPLTTGQLNAALNAETRYAFVVIDAESGEAIGHAEIHLTGNSAYLSRILVGEKAMRGKGLGLRIVQQLLAIAFQRLQQQKVELNVFDWNTSAIKCYQKAGFTLNPAKKAERTINGQTWLALNMTIDKRRWETTLTKNMDPCVHFNDINEPSMNR